MEVPFSRLSVRVCLAVGVVLCGAGSVGAQTALPSPWKAQDVGAPAIAGASSAGQASGPFTIDAGGSDIWFNSDQFRFVYQTMTGDGTITARVDSLGYADDWAKAGVMIRSSLSANAAHGFALVSAGKGSAFQRRPSVGGASVHTTGTAVWAPQWLRISRSGTTVTASVAPDGGSWTTIGSDTIALGATAYVGIAVTSHNPNQSTEAVVSNVTVTGAAGAMPAAQQDQDIGAPSIAGSATYQQGTYTVKAAGRDIWGTGDEFHYVFQPVTGDVDISVRVSSLVNVDRWSKAGVMIREDLSDDSAHAFAAVSSEKGYLFQRRPTGGGSSQHTDGGSGTAPGWVRLKRSGALITAYRSSNGSTWTVIGSDSFTMADTVYVGLAVTSHDASQATTAMFDTLNIAQSQPSNQPPVVTLAAPANGASYTAPATVPLAASASDSDGSVARVEFYAGSTLIATDTSAPYSYSWSSVAAGTYPVKAVAYDNSGASTSSATGTVTVTAVSANKPPTVTLTSPSNGANYPTPATISLAASASDTDGTVSRVEFYAGSTLLGTDSSAPYTYTWGGGTGTSAAVKLVQHTGVDAGNADRASLPFASANTAGNWIGVAIRAGNVGQVLSVTDSRGNVYRKAVQLDETTDRTSLALYYAENVAGGSNTVTVTKSISGGSLRLSVVEYSGVASSGSLDTVAAARGSTASPSSGPASATVPGELVLGLITTANSSTPTAGSGFTIQERVPTSGPKLIVEDKVQSAAGSATASLSLSSSDNWGALVATFRPASGSSGSQGPAAGTYALKAVAYDDKGASTTSATATITVGAANKAPTVTLTSPANGGSYTAPASISLAATASDADGTVSRVEFYAGSTLLNTDSSAPYSYSWGSVPAGTYALKAVAYDDKGASTSSATATVTVGSSNKAPTVTLTSPANGGSYTAPASISLAASASDTDGTVSRVEFYAGTTLLNTDTSAPYSYTWGSVPAGTYALKAVAYDNAGASATSAVATITVGAASTPPTAVAFQASVDHATGVTSYRLDVFANGANPATGTPVASSNLGKPQPDGSGTITVDRASFFSALAPGTYGLTISAVGPGGESRSATVTFTR